MTRKPVIAVIGPGSCTSEQAAIAEEVGAALARRGAIVATGGLGGIMEAASRGAQQAGGLVLGILPGSDPAAANPSVDVPLATGLGEARNVVLVTSAQAVVAVGGALGTLSEIAFALKAGRPVIGLNTWSIDPNLSGGPAVVAASSVDDAVSLALVAAGAGAPRGV